MCSAPLVLWGPLGGCSSVQRTALDVDPAAPAMVWPASPETPRVRFLGSIATPADIGRSRSIFRRVIGFLVGSQEERIVQPYGTAVNGSGQLYVADPAARGVHVFDITARHYRFVPGADGERFRFPVGVAVDERGRLFVSDADAATVVGLDGDHVFLRIATGLERPAGLAYDPAARVLYVVDVAGHRIRVYNLDGTLRLTFGGRGEAAGELNFPTNVAVDANGNVYVTDTMNFRVQIFRPDGSFVREFGRVGDARGDLARPKGVGVDPDGHVYVVEGLYDAVNVYDRNGRHLLTFGEPGTGAGEFWLATGLFVDARGRIFVADSHNGRIQVFQYLGQRRAGG